MNDTSASAAEGASNAAPRRSKWKIVLAIVAILFLGAGIFWIVDPTGSVPRVVVLQNGFPSARRGLGIVSRLPPSAQQFVYRVKYQLLGPPKAVNVKTTILHFEFPPQTIASRLSLTKSEFTGTNGVSIWILATNELQKLYLHAAALSEIQQISSPQFSTAHGIRASTAVTRMLSIHGKQRPVGLTLDALPYVRKDSLDLSLLLSVIEAVTNTVSNPSSATDALVSIRTNCFVALRMQIPDGSGAFILQENAGRSGGKGVFITPSVARTKK
jgi:hypothetical protein